MKCRTFFWNAASLLIIFSMLLSATFVFSASPVFAQTEPPEDPETVTSEALTLDPELSVEEVGQVEAETAALMDRALAEGSVGVIVVLNVADAPERALGERGEEGVMVYAAAQDALMFSLRGRSIQNVHKYQNFPMMAMRVDAAALRALLRHHMVAAVQEDSINYPTLVESSAIIGANDAAALGYTGAGYSVAIIDTGVQYTHPFLTGKVIEGACFSGGLGYATTTCPNGQSYQLGIEAGAACTVDTEDCSHGTHVAGIAAGSGASFNGVARGASIIAYNVFSWHNTYGLVTYDSDYIQALDDVYYLKKTLNYNIASVNMSLGGGGYTKYCDAKRPATKKAIDRLRSVNIATVIASGNDGYTNAISAPGCISTAVSVGSTNKSDNVSAYSNYASFLSLLAPGEDIYSSIPGNAYDSLDGTSMAAPQVAGAWAVLRQALPTQKTVPAILSLLKTTGVPVKDFRNGKVKPRINVAFALGKYMKPTQTSILLSPPDTANLNDSTPLLYWQTVPLASKYKVTIKRNGTSTVYSKTVKAWEVCDVVGTTCMQHVPTILKGAMYTWTVQAYSGAGGGPVSLPRTFYTPISMPANVSLGEPQGSIVGYNQPTFNWTLMDTPWADKFYFTLYKDGKRVISKTYEAFKVCQMDICSVPAPKTLTTGSYSWEIKPWNLMGYGAIVSANFTVDLSAGYSNSFDSNYRGITLLYPWNTGGWWWLNTSKLITFYGANYTWASMRLEGTYKDIDMTVGMYRSGNLNNSNGLVIRGVPTLMGYEKDWKTGYQFLYTQAGYYSIWKKYNNKLYNIQPWTATTGIVNLSGYNIARVRTVGATMYFYINGSLLWYGAEHVPGPDLNSGVPGIMSYVGNWSISHDYLYIDSLTTVVPGTTTSDAEETISAEQLALNEDARANPTGSPFGPNVSMAEYEYLLSATDKPVTTLEQKIQACLEAGIEGCPTVLPE